MPIRPENRKLYPENWKALATDLKAKAGMRCQGGPAYPDCRALHGQPHPVTGSMVVLTVAHLDHCPENVELTNLRVWCQKCHNTYDAKTRAAARKARRQGGVQLEMFPSEPDSLGRSDGPAVG